MKPLNVTEKAKPPPIPFVPGAIAVRETLTASACMPGSVAIAASTPAGVASYGMQPGPAPPLRPESPTYEPEDVTDPAEAEQQRQLKLKPQQPSAAVKN